MNWIKIGGRLIDTDSYKQFYCKDDIDSMARYFAFIYADGGEYIANFSEVPEKFKEAQEKRDNLFNDLVEYLADIKL